MATHLRKRSRAAVVVASTAVVAIASSGIAYGFWTTSGSGAGSATAGTALVLPVSGTASVSGLYPTASNLPGGTIQVTNPNPFNVTLTSTAFASAVTTTSGCTGTTVTFNVAAGAPTSIAKNAFVSVPFTASMSNAAENQCQGATFTALLSVSAKSAP